MNILVILFDTELPNIDGLIICFYHFYQINTSDFSDNLCLVIEQMAEILQFPFVIAIEKQLVEAGEIQDFVPAVKFGLDGYHTPSGRRYTQVFNDCAC